MRSTHTAIGTLSVSVLAALGFAAAAAGAAPASRPRRADGASGGQIAGTWKATTKMSTVREGAIAAPLPDGKVLVAGGDNGEFARDVDNSSAYTLSAEIYDPASGTWTPTGSMIAYRQAPVSATLPGGKVLVAGGFSGSGYLASAEIYDPASGTWTPTGSMTTVREAATAATLPGGKVLVAGGDNASPVDVSSSFLASVEIYDSASGTWQRTASMATARDATATVLPGGKVLLAGGFGPAGPFLNSAEVYDPAKRTWTATGEMVIGGEGATATPLPGGKVLVAGGHNQTGVLAAAEVFTPAKPPRIAIHVSSRTLRHRRVRVRLRCSGAQRWSGMVRLKARTRGRRVHQVGHRRYDIRQGHHTAGVRLGHRARRELDRRGHLRVTAIATLRGIHQRADDGRKLRRPRHGPGKDHHGSAR